MMAFALPLTALILGAAPGIIRLLFGSHFGPAVVLLRILAFNVLFVALMAVFWRSLAARGRQAAVLQVQLAVIGLRLGGGAALIAPFAALGAAIATSASSALQFALLVIATARSGAPTPIFRPAWRFAIAAVPTTAVTWILADHVSIWVTLPAGTVVYVLGVIAFRAVSADDRALMARLLPRALARGQ
jgi:O-antigen/teichoic acid export membrane protein